MAPKRPDRLAQRARKVKGVLARFERLGCSRAELLERTGIPPRSLSRLLAFLLGRKEIVEPFRGHFMLAGDGQEILSSEETREGVHGLVLTTLDGPSGILPMVAARLRSSPSARPDARHTVPRWHSFYTDWRERVVEVRVYRTDRILVYVASTRRPYAWHELEELAGFIGALLHPFDPDRLWVVEIGVNVDYKGWRMKGCKAMEFRAFRNGFRQMYEGHGGIRDEAHLHERPGVLSLANAARTLKEGSALAQAERIANKRIRELELRLKLIEKEKATGAPPKPSPPPPPLTDLSGSGYG